MHTPRHRQITHVRRELIGAFSLTVIAALIIVAFNTSSLSAKNDVEAKFADNSSSGLAIVPASCPSSPHYYGHCTGISVCDNGLPIQLYPNCVCPAGTHIVVGDTISTCEPDTSCVSYAGSPCTSPPNSCGQTHTGEYRCDGSCTASQLSDSNCPGGGGGGGGGGGNCVSNAGQACAPNSCGMTGGTIQCGGSCSGTPPSDNLCPKCWDGTIVNGGSDNCPACPEDYTKSGYLCIPPDGPTFESFTMVPAPSSGSALAKGDLMVRPSLLKAGRATQIFWKVKNAKWCTVTGSNGDDVTAGMSPAQSLFSGASGIKSSPIMSRTTYTLFCKSLNGATPPSITEMETVNIIPEWAEDSVD